MNYQTQQLVSNILSVLLVIGIVIGVCSLIGYSYHHDRMSTGDDGFSWKCTYNPHTDVIIK